MLPRTCLIEAAISSQHLAVFHTLLSANDQAGLQATLRVAGGWVRDTLLGMHSNDIDIAIETPPGLELVSGERFARVVSSYQAAASNAAERTVSVIRVNPALSKHIETATVCVQDMAVEFCALRTDDYTDDSRIPTVRPATPQEDALRRDFTINALFYNLHTQRVEDFTSGLEDLAKRVIRCPMAPAETFTDDPLRLLRGVRFVGQLGELGFTLDPSIIAAVDSHLLHVLQVKVSRERVGKEFLKMMSSPCPDKCLELLLTMKLLQNILLVEVHMPPTKKKQQAAPAQPLRTTTLMGSVLSAEASEQYWHAVIRSVVPLFGGVQPLFDIPSDSRVVGILFCLVIAFYRDVDAQEVEHRLTALCMSGLKLSQVQFQGVRRMVDCYNRLVAATLSAEEFQQGALHDTTKLKIFESLSLLNDGSVVHDSFKVVVCMYTVLEWNKAQFCSGNSTGADVQAAFLSVWGYLAQYPALLDAFSITLPIKGNEVRSQVGVPPKEIGAALLELRRQAAFYPGTVDTPDEAMSWLKARYPGTG